MILFDHSSYLWYRSWKCCSFVFTFNFFPKFIQSKLVCFFSSGKFDGLYVISSLKTAFIGFYQPTSFLIFFINFCLIFCLSWHLLFIFFYFITYSEYSGKHVMILAKMFTRKKYYCRKFRNSIFDFHYFHKIHK